MSKNRDQFHAFVGLGSMTCLWLFQTGNPSCARDILCKPR